MKDPADIFIACPPGSHPISSLWCKASPVCSLRVPLLPHYAGGFANSKITPAPPPGKHFCQASFEEPFISLKKHLVTFLPKW